MRNGEEEAQKMNDEWKQYKRPKPRPAKPKEVEVRGNIDGLLQELEDKLGTPYFRWEMRAIGKDLNILRDRSPFLVNCPHMFCPY